jgi:two-component system, cell cycle sensor histidine kinase and response regulator CckA
MLNYMIYSKFFYQIPDFLVVINREYKVEMCNWRGAYQYVPKERRRLGTHCYEMFYPGQDRPCDDCHAAVVFRTGQPLVREKLNPAVGHVEIRCFPVFDWRGEVIMVAEQICNVTPRKQAEQELRSRNQFLQTLLDAIPVPVFYKDERGCYQGCNQPFAEFLGRPRQEIVGRTVYDIAPKELADIYHEADLELFLKGENQVYENSVVDADGASHQVVFHKATFAKPDGSLGGLVGTILDVTERQQAMDRLQESEQRYRHLFEEAMTGNYVATVDGRLVACNPAFACIFGFDSVAEALKMDLRDLHPDPGRREVLLEKLRREKKIEHYPLEVRSPDGRNLNLLLNAVGIFDDGGDLVELRGYILDDTERKSLREQLNHSQKMEAVGRLAGGLAHDFNNLLTVVLGYSEVLLSRLQDPQLVHCVEQIKQAGDRAAALTGQLLTFSRRQVSHPEELELNAVLEGLAAMLKGLVGERVELAILTGRDLGYVRADLSQLEQVVMNLAVNARDAMPDGGKLTLALANVRIDAPRTCSPVEVKPGDYIVLTVGDTGQGIAPAALPYIFEPFFTTKQRGKGTGLGLSLVYGIVSQSGGGIDVQSAPGEGTTFRIYLPRVRIGADSVQPGAGGD